MSVGTKSRDALSGVCVLVAEDEYYIADDVQRALKGAGADIFGPCGSLEPALKAVDEGGYDCAVIDLNLHGESAAPIADRLAEKHCPFAIATGYGSGNLPERHRDVPRIEKPFDADALVSLVKGLVRS